MCHLCGEPSVEEHERPSSSVIQRTGAIFSASSPSWFSRCLYYSTENKQRLSDIAIYFSVILVLFWLHCPAPDPNKVMLPSAVDIRSD
jgi:hypothetical protein